MQNKKEDIFRKTLQSVTEIVKSQDSFFTKEQMVSYFKDMELTQEQEELIYQYLKDSFHDEKLEQQNLDSQTSEERTEQEKYNQELRKCKTETVLPNTVFFQMYLAELREIPDCLPQEEKELYEKLINGDESALKKLLHQWLPRLILMVQNHSIPTEEVSDIVQEANMEVFLTLSELLGSGKHIDYQKKIYEAAQKAIDAYLDETQANKEFEQSLLTKVSFIQEARQFLIEQYQRIPTIDELSQYTKMPVAELSDIIRIARKIQDN